MFLYSYQLVHAEIKREKKQLVYHFFFFEKHARAVDERERMTISFDKNTSTGKRIENKQSNHEGVGIRQRFNVVDIAEPSFPQSTQQQQRICNGDDLSVTMASPSSHSFRHHLHHRPQFHHHQDSEEIRPNAHALPGK